MFLKKLFAILLSALIIFSLSACSHQSASQFADTDDSPLMIYICDNDEYMKYHISTYNSLFDEPQIEYEAFTSYSMRFLEKRIEKEIKNDHGPDLIKIDSSSFYYYDFVNMVEDGLFADLNIIIKNNKRFDTSLYNEDMLDGGIIDGQRAFIPASYTIDLALSSTQSFKNNGLEPLDSLTTNDLISTMEAYYQNTTDNKCPFLNIDLCLSAFSYMNEDNYFEDTDELRQLLDTYKPSIKRGLNSGLNEAFKNQNFDYYDWYIDNEILFTRLYGKCDDIYERVFNKYNLFKNKYNRDLMLYSYPLLSEKVKAYPETAFAISATSRKMNKALSFIEYMLSTEVQTDSKYVPTVSVNIEAYQLSKDKFLSSNYDFSNSEEFSQIPYELAYQAIDLVENADFTYDNSLYLYSHYGVAYYLRMYVRGGRHYDNLIEDINEGLYKYYNDIEDYHF